MLVVMLPEILSHISRLDTLHWTLVRICPLIIYTAFSVTKLSHPKKMF